MFLWLGLLFNTISFFHFPLHKWKRFLVWLGHWPAVCRGAHYYCLVSITSNISYISHNNNLLLVFFQSLLATVSTFLLQLLKLEKLRGQIVAKCLSVRRAEIVEERVRCLVNIFSKKTEYNFINFFLKINLPFCISCVQAMSHNPADNNIMKLSKLKIARHFKWRDPLLILL